MGLADRLYSRLPTVGQHAAVTAYGAYWYMLRFGGNYRQELRQYLERERFTAEEWQTFLGTRLREVLSGCAAHVEYYRRTWTADQKAAARRGELSALPLLAKDAVRAAPREFLREDIHVRAPRTYHTSGSTGTPIASIWSPADVRRSRAAREARSNGWAGVSYSRPRATFSGRMVEPDPASKGPFYRFNAIEKQVYLSAFHLRSETAPLYAEALTRHRVEWLSGYAVSFFLLAQHILAQRLEVPTLKAVVTTSEKVTPEMRSVMEEAYRCPVFEEYGTVENIMLATECSEHHLHVSPDAGIVEILRQDGTPCEPGEVGEVVATGLMRQYQPLVRYRLGDLASWSQTDCPCGRSMPVIEEVVGRLEDVVVGPDGRRLVRFHGVFVGLPAVEEGQVIQEAIDRIVVRVVPTSSFSEQDVAEITSRVRQRLGPNVTVTVERVDRIPRTKAGKFKAVISHVTTPS